MTFHFLNYVANDTESTHKSTITSSSLVSLNSEYTCKLKTRIPSLRLLISGLPGSALRTHVESLGKPRDVNKGSQSLAW